MHTLKTKTARRGPVVGSVLPHKLFLILMICYSCLLLGHNKKNLCCKLDEYIVQKYSGKTQVINISLWHVSKIEWIQLTKKHVAQRRLSWQSVLKPSALFTTFSTPDMCLSNIYDLLKMFSSFMFVELNTRETPILSSQLIESLKNLITSVSLSFHLVSFRTLIRFCNWSIERNRHFYTLSIRNESR